MLTYADDAVLFTYGSNVQTIAANLTKGLSNVHGWLKQSCLMLNPKKTVCMMFSKKNIKQYRSFVFLDGEELELVTHFKYLGVILDSNLTFKKHIKMVSNTIKFGLQNFKQIRSSITTEAAKSYLHCMIFSHIEYCLTTWSFAGTTALKPIEQLYKKAIRVRDKKPQSFHICILIDKYKFLNFENLKIFKNTCLVYRVLHGLAPPPLNDFVKIRNCETSTRSTSRGDCEVQFKKCTFSQNVLSIKGSSSWNILPMTIRECTTYVTFKRQLRELEGRSIFYKQVNM